MRVLLAVCILAVISLAYGQVGLFAGAYLDAACNSPFGGLVPGVLASGLCVQAAGQFIKLTDSSGKYNAGLACSDSTCGTCSLNQNNLDYGVCSAVTPAYALVYKVVEGTSLTVDVYDAAGCTGTARGSETYTSTSFPTACGGYQSVALQGFARPFDLGSKVAIQTSCNSTAPCGGCQRSFVGDNGACIQITDASLAGNTRYVKVTRAGSSTTAAPTTKPSSTSTAAIVSFSAFVALIVAIAMMF